MPTLRLSGRLVTVALACSLLAACNSRMSGHYKNPNELMEIEFKGSTAYLSMIGTTMEVKYRVDGDHVVFDTPQGQLVFTKNPNGTLEGAGFVLSRTD